jgi:hypothetical protein
MSKPKVFFGLDKSKKQIDNDETEVVELKDYKSSGKTATAYSYAYNDNRKHYDLFITTIDLTTLESETEVEKLRVDSEARAIMEIQRRQSDDLIKRMKRR